MKLLSILSLFILFTFSSSCIYSTDDQIAGNGNVVTNEVAVDSFTGLVINCHCNIEIIQSDYESVIIEADENLHEYLKIYLEGKDLVVKNADNIQFKKFKKCVVSIYVKDLTKIKSSGVGNVKTITPIAADNMDLSISSVGNNNFELIVSEIIIVNSSVGNTTISGSADRVNLKNSSVGNLKMKDFYVAILYVNNSAVGNVHVFASEEIYIKNSGIGNLTYSGDAKIMEMNTSGIGNVKKQ
jgi:hypothetical protein